MAQTILSNTLSDTMIMMLLDHYVWSFHTWLMIANCLKSTIKYGKKLKNC